MKPPRPHERLALALSPDLFAERLFGIKLDPWQRDVCLERRNSILRLGRQSGETEAFLDSERASMSEAQLLSRAGARCRWGEADIGPVR